MLPRVVHRNDVLVMEISGRLHLPQKEAIEHILRVARVPVLQHFDRDGATNRRVLRAEHYSHSAGAYDVEDCVFADLSDRGLNAHIVRSSAAKKSDMISFRNKIHEVMHGHNKGKGAVGFCISCDHLRYHSCKTLSS